MVPYGMIAVALIVAVGLIAVTMTLSAPTPSDRTARSRSFPGR